MATLEIHWARAEFVNGIQLELQPAQPIQAKAGDRLILKTTYKFTEMSKDRDAVHLTFKASTGRTANEPVTLDIKDRTGLADDEWGFIAQTFKSLSAGEHRIDCSLHAEWTTQDRHGGKINSTTETLEGSVVVHVAK